LSENIPVTKGIHHVGLTVSDLEGSANFFKALLGWSEVRRDPDYPAIFVSDGKIMITLWGVKSEEPVEFNKNQNVGLHHLALQVESMEELDNIQSKLSNSNIKFEFHPEPLRGGPAKHMMCYEPSGIRVEHKAYEKSYFFKK